MKLRETGFFGDGPDEIVLQSDWRDTMLLMEEAGFDYSGLAADGSPPRDIGLDDLHSTLDVILG
ncbi:MAG: hypothetical protein AB8B83_07615 [Bdellovibrionales bacterium]